MKKTFLSILLLSIVNLAFGQNNFQKELFSADVVMKYRSEIELSDAQVSKIKKIYNNHSASFNNAKWDLDAEMTSLNKQLEANQVNEKKAMAQMKKVTTLENDLKEMQLAMLIKIKNELSSEQVTKLKGLRTSDDLRPLSLITSVNKDQKVKLQLSKPALDVNIEPLYIVVDREVETVVEADFIQRLSPAKIESVSVFKDRSAVKIYGKKAKDGVIVVKLKDKN